MTPHNQAGNVENFTKAVGNISRELLAAGIAAEPLAAALRIEVAKLESTATRGPMRFDEAEILDTQRRAHEFINTLQVAGIEERVAITSVSNALIERVVRTHGAAGGAHWLRNLAALIDRNGDFIERTAGHH